ncbi:MAG TPA: DUF2071 domain-containing protein [Gaiellaceae bacterium]|nr:DUF2071 domain-containing protein [Gaiellaceae bacterium]
MEASARQAATLQEVGHRPWPLPDGRWVQAQTWEDLLFAHWALPTGALAARLPAGLHLDTFEGQAYLGITPFRVTNLRVRGLLPMPVLSSFLELNCRTYVTDGEKPGIWFFSLDASSRFAVEAARRIYKLPYFRARMRPPPRFMSVRAEGAGDHAWASAYEPAGAVLPASPGSLEHFLAERYCLYTVDDVGRLRRAEIHHPPWPLQGAAAEVSRNTIPPHGLGVSGDPHVMFAARQDVVIWALEPATSGSYQC